MTEAPKKTGKKFKFFKFKAFGSLSNLPRTFTLRRSSATVNNQPCQQPDAFENTQDDMINVPKSPGAYARSSDMYSHMGTMPRPGSKKGSSRGQGQRPQEEAGSPAPSLASRELPQVPAPSPDLGSPELPNGAVPGSPADEEAATTRGTAALCHFETSEASTGTQPTDTSGKAGKSVGEAPKEKALMDSPLESVHSGLESGGDYVKFSKEKYILDSSPEKLHKELEEELKLSSTDLRSHAWYHGRIPREVSESLVQRNGDFLIRDSLTSLGDYVLTCRWHNQPLHFKVNKVMVKASENYTHIQYLFEQESFDHVPALVRYYVGSRKAVSEQSGAIIYCPINRTFPLRYLEASYGLAHGKSGGPASPSSQKGGHMKRRSVTMTDGLTADKITRGEGCPTSVSLPPHRDAIRNCALSMDQIPDLHSPMSPISESPGSPAYSTVTRANVPGIPSAGMTPASPVIRRSSEPQLCPGNGSKPPSEPSNSVHPTPCHSYRQASPSPSLNSYGDPDSGHYCQLQPPMRGSRERVAPEPPTRLGGVKSYVERLKVEEGQHLMGGRAPENGPHEGDQGGGFIVPVIEVTSSFNPTTFQSLLIPKDNKPLEMSILKKVKELLADVDAKTLARHVTKVDCLVARILGVTKEMQGLMGVRSGMELLTLPHGRQLRLDLLERFHTMSIMLAVDILGCTGSTEERAALLHKTIQLAAELRGTMGNMFSFAAVMSALDMAQISRLEQTWMALRQRHTEGAILYEKKLKPFLKSLNEGKDSPPLSNTTFPHVLPLITLLECDTAPAEGPEPWESTEHGVEVVLAHLEAARTVAHHGGLYHTNAEVKLQGFQALPELLEVFSTEFQMRLLWGSQGAASSQALRYEKFDKVLTALSHKLEPAVRSSEL